MAKGKYTEWLKPEGLLKIEGWARDGLTDEQIAENIGINVSTLYEWKNRFPEFSESLKKGKEVVDREVENALFERALGGLHEVRKTFKVKNTFYDEKGRKCEREELKTGVDEIYIPGDTTAQIFWLKNRKPEKWRDKQEIQDTTAIEKLDDILKEMRNNAVKQQTE